HLNKRVILCADVRARGRRDRDRNVDDPAIALAGVVHEVDRDPDGLLLGPAAWLRIRPKLCSLEELWDGQVVDPIAVKVNVYGVDFVVADQASIIQDVEAELSVIDRVLDSDERVGNAGSVGVGDIKQMRRPTIGIIAVEVALSDGRESRACRGGEDSESYECTRWSAMHRGLPSVACRGLVMHGAQAMLRE